MSNYMLSVWTNKTTGQKRIYINGGLIDRADKVWIEADRSGLIDAKMTTEGYGYAYKSAFGGSNKSDWAMELADRALVEAGIEFNVLRTQFADVLAKVEG